MGARNEDLYTSLGNRLLRLDRQLSDKERDESREMADRRTASQIAAELLSPYDLDRIEQKARQDHGIPTGHYMDESLLNRARESPLDAAGAIFSGELNDCVRRIHEQLVDAVNLDKVEFTGWAESSGKRGENLISNFKEYIEEIRDEVTAFKIFFSQPYQQLCWTYQMIREVLDHLKKHRPHLAPLRVYQAYAELDGVTKDKPQSDLISLITVIRRATGMDDTLHPYDEMINRNFKQWIFHRIAGPVQFTEQQMEWLRMIRDQIRFLLTIWIMPNLTHVVVGAGCTRSLGNQYKNFSFEMNNNLVA